MITTSFTKTRQSRVQQLSTQIESIAYTLRHSYKKLEPAKHDASGDYKALFDNALDAVAESCLEVSYHGLFARIRLSHLRHWLDSPTQILAAQYQVTPQLIDRWIVNKNRYVLARCCHPDCEEHGTIDYETPQQLADIEERIARDKWVCHRHQHHQWQEKQMLGMDVRDILTKISAEPGINKSRLGARVRHIDFLITASLIQVETTGGTGSKARYNFYVTQAGEQALLTTKAKA